jgi:hypothetical protein
MTNGDTAREPWQDWAPPTDPPTAGGIPFDVAQAIADVYWSDEPHMCAALQWEYYAAMQDPSPSVVQVSTGVQSIAYSPPAPGGEYGRAIAKAQWHRSFLSGYLETVPLISSIRSRELLPPLPEFVRVLDQEGGSWLPQ